MKTNQLPLRISSTFLLASLLPALIASPVILKRGNKHQAPAITTNPTDVVYRADFPSFNSPNVVGIVQFYSLNGTTKIHIDLTGLPKNAGLFSYHIHENGIPTDDVSSSACEAAGMHFNPFNAPMAKDVTCDSYDNDARCQVGDLSGKHGMINTTCYETYYYDPYISLDPNDAAFIGGKSLVLHLEDNTKLACANIMPAYDPEDLVLINPEAEAEQIREFVEAAYGDRTKIVYFSEDANIKKRAEEDRFDIYEDLDWGLTQEVDEEESFVLEEGDEDMQNKNVMISPIMKNATEYVGNGTMNGTAVNAGNTTTPSKNSASAPSVHVFDCLRILAIGICMSLF